MPSRISFCNQAVFRKNLTRFFPLWTLYAMGLVLGLVLILQDAGDWYGVARNVRDAISFFTVLQLGYALLCAQLLFGDLFSSRMCNALHALPLRRETWFFTHVCSGLFFLLVPQTVFSLLLLPFLHQAWLLAVYLLVCTGLSFVFYFGSALFCMQCAGNRLAAVLVYGLLQFLPMLCLWLVDSLYRPQLYGVPLYTEPFLRCCPTVTLGSQSFFQVNKQGIPVVVAEGFWYYPALAAAGIAFGGVALWLYRRRQLEGAGDFLVVRPMAKVFLLVYSLCIGCFVYLFFSLFGIENQVFLYIGIVVGYFTGQMLLRRTAKVFEWRVFLGLGALCVLLALSLGITRLDPLGITRRVPEADSIRQVELYGIAGYYREDAPYVLQEPSAIRDIQEAHRDLIANPTGSGRGENLVLTYRLQNGDTLTREYRVRASSQAGQLLRKYFSRPQTVLRMDPEEIRNNPHRFVLELSNGRKLTGKDLLPFLDAFLLDCAEQTTVQSWAYHDEQKVVVFCYLRTAADYEKDRWAEIAVYTDCTHMMDWLESQGYLLPEEGVKPGF